MKPLLAFTNIKTNLLLVSLLITAATSVKAQNYWDKIPTFTSQCYSENDDFVKNIQQLRSEVKEKIQKDKEAVELKASKMSNEERMAMVTKYQNMSPDEIVKMQKEMTEMTQGQTAFQVASSAFEDQFNQLESDFRTEFAKRLGPIESEYRKLPDGEGTPQWAIKKGEELTIQYNKEYESICNKYFTSPDAKFRVWLNDFSTFLHEEEVPFNQKMIKMQYGQFGIAVDDSTANLMAVERYLEKCSAIFNLRRPYPQG
jgi:Spy/CpxP family protein refolding chaperone